MPIYEYLCNNCNERVEHFLISSKDTEPAECPKCNGKSLERIISRTNFELKGECWAKDGYTHKDRN